MDWNRLRARASRALIAPWLPASQRHLLRPIDPYADWRAQNHLSEAARADLRDALDKRSNLPRISVIMPVYRPNRTHFSAVIESIRGQAHDEWELCLCDDGSADPDLTGHLARLAHDDARIRYCALPANGGISAATQAAVELSSGDVLLFVDQDDLLAPDCIAELAISFADNSEVDIVYSDSDKIRGNDEPFAPSFKPGWSPTLLLSYMYLGHAMALRRSLFDRAGGLRSAFDGSQDYDLALRASEQARHVKHIPRILYHWRMVPGSTATSAAEKPYSLVAARHALQETLHRRQIDAEVVQPDWAERATIGLFALRFKPFAGTLTAILFDRPDAPINESWLRDIVESLPPDARITVVLAGGGALESQDLTSRCAVVPSRAREPLAKRLASAMSGADSDMVLLLKAGLRPLDGNWLTQLLGYASLPGVGIAGTRLLDEQDKIVSAGLVVPSGSGAAEPAFAGLSASRHGAMYLARTTRECAAVSAACLAVRGDLVDMFDLVPFTLDDPVSIGIALSERIRNTGSSVLICADADMRDAHAAHAPPRPSPRLPDRWYNPNLGRERTQFRPARRGPPLRREAVPRVASVVHNLDREGSQTALLDLLAGLKAAGLADPFIVSAYEGPLRLAAEAAKIPVLIIPSPGRRVQGARRADYEVALAATFVDHHADVVLANSLESHSAISAASCAGLGSVWWQHEGGSWRGYFHRLPRSVRARAYAAVSQCYRLVQVADATRFKWLPLAVRDNFETIRHAIPPARLDAERMRWSRADAREALGIAPHECVILLMGSVSARKGQADIVRLMATLPSQSGRDFRIIIAGRMVDETYAARMAALLDSLPAPRRAQIHMAGEVSDTALYYSAADIFLCCSREESAPRAILEAMSFALPVVTTSVDGIPELVQDRVNGHLFEVGDNSTLTAHLLRLSASLSECTRLGRAGFDLANELNDYEGMVARFGALLRDAARLRRYGNENEGWRSH